MRTVLLRAGVQQVKIEQVKPQALSQLLSQALRTGSHSSVTVPRSRRAEESSQAGQTLSEEGAFHCLHELHLDRLPLNIPISE